MIQKLTKKLSSLLLAASVVLSMLPIPARALESCVHAGESGTCTACGAVEITRENFPDDAFRAFLQGETYGADGWLTTKELSDVTVINVYGQGIADLTGIGYFTELTHLTCSDNRLTELDLSQNTALEALYCTYNQLATLDVSRNGNLKTLGCGSNYLTSLDLGNNAKLVDLSAAGNVYTVELSANRKLDLRTLPGEFDVSRAKNWVGGTVEGTVLTANGSAVTYDYEVGQGKTVSFTLYCVVRADCSHAWQEATCTSAKTCTLCGKTEGEALGHAWKDATCTEAKTCTRCGVTEGASLGHIWKDATCTEAKTCTRCGVTEGDSLGHVWKDPTCNEAGVCTRCGATGEPALGHAWKGAT